MNKLFVEVIFLILASYHALFLAQGLLQIHQDAKFLILNQKKMKL